MMEEKGRCVVLADRHQNILEGVRGLLETAFETVVMVADRQSLFEAIEKVKPDLAVVDLSLPPNGRASIAHEINDCYPELKFIILSTHDEPTVLEEVMSAGASAFVLKQSAAVDLFEAVQSVREGYTFISGSLKKQ
jgi:DNA-binding NarL/FixJ family response regulator